MIVSSIRQPTPIVSLYFVRSSGIPKLMALETVLPFPKITKRYDIIDTTTTPKVDN
jgi:hypothetical protein